MAAVFVAGWLAGLGRFGDFAGQTGPGCFAGNSHAAWQVVAAYDSVVPAAAGRVVVGPFAAAVLVGVASAAASSALAAAPDRPAAIGFVVAAAAASVPVLAARLAVCLAYVPAAARASAVVEDAFAGAAWPAEDFVALEQWLVAAYVEESNLLTLREVSLLLLLLLVHLLLCHAMAHGLRIGHSTGHRLPTHLRLHSHARAWVLPCHASRHHARAGLHPHHRTRLRNMRCSRHAWMHHRLAHVLSWILSHPRVSVGKAWVAAGRRLVSGHHLAGATARTVGGISGEARGRVPDQT